MKVNKFIITDLGRAVGVDSVVARAEGPALPLCRTFRARS